MKVSRKTQRRVIYAVIMVGCCLLQGRIWAESSADPFLDVLPSDCLMYIRINQFDQTLNGLGQYLTGVVPVDAGSMARMQLMGILGNMNLAGIDMSGNFGAYIPAPSAEEKGLQAMQRPPLILIPVNDYQQFLTASTNVSEPDDQGVCRIGEKALVTQVGGYALIQPEGTVAQLVSEAVSLKQKKTSLASGLTPEDILSAQKQGLWIYVNIQEIAKTMGPELVEKLKSTGEFMEQQLKMAGPMAMPMGSPRAGFDMYARMLDIFLKEAKSLTVQAHANTQALEVGLSLSALPNTSLHECLVLKITDLSNQKLLGFLPDSAMMNFVVHGDPAHMAKVNAKMIDFFIISEESPLDEKTKADMRTMMDNMVKAMGSTFLFSMEVAEDTKPPFKGVYVFETKDENAYEQMLSSNVDFIKNPSFTKMMQAQGMEIGMKNQKAVDEHQGVAIHSFIFYIKATDPNAPQAQFIKAIYGDGFETRWAVVDNMGLGAMGPDANAQVKKLIDQVKSGTVPPMGSEFKEAMAVIPESNKANLIGTYNILRVFKMIPAIMPMPITLPSIDFPSKSNMAMAGWINNGTAQYRMVLPKIHLLEIQQAFQQVMQQQMQMKMQQQGGVQPGMPMPMPQVPIR